MTFTTYHAAMCIKHMPNEPKNAGIYLCLHGNTYFKIPYQLSVGQSFILP